MFKEPLEHILAVDDEEQSRFALKSVLRKSEFKDKYTLASSGYEAWNLLQENPKKYTVILLDRMMPGMNGMELLKLIKDDNQLKSIPIIFLTAMANTKDVVEGISAGALYYVTKPFEASILLAIIRSALGDYKRANFMQNEISEMFSVVQRLDFASIRFKTMEESAKVANFIARACPDPGKALLGLSELCNNAVEHGLAGISYFEKKELLLKGRDNLQDEISLRLNLPENRHKSVLLYFRRKLEKIDIIIKDYGTGFNDWNKFLDFSSERSKDPNGRGISLARLMSFDEIRYIGNGNTVIAKINL